MIRLKNIERNHGVITCLAFVEDAPDGIQLSFDEQKKQFKSDPLPKGYEYCKTHIVMARRYLGSLFDKAITNRNGLLCGIERYD